VEDPIIRKWQSRKRDGRYLASQYKELIKSKPDPSTAEEIHNQVFEEIDCLSCANCCKTIPPMVSGTDAKRIAKFMGISKKAFLNDYTLTDEDGDRVMNASPCPFLESDNRCRIYEARPSACRLYPHSGEYLFVENIKHHKRNMKYCPGLMEIVFRLASIK